MSTRAIVEAKDKKEVWKLYCHGDGAPDQAVGTLINEFVAKAPSIDPNNVKWHKGIAYPSYVASNVSLESSKFIASFTGYLWEGGYYGAYMTTRDAEEEKQKDWTDIEYLYRVILDGSGNLDLNVIEL